MGYPSKQPWLHIDDVGDDDDDNDDDIKKEILKDFILPWSVRLHKLSSDSDCKSIFNATEIKFAVDLKCAVQPVTKF